MIPEKDFVYHIIMDEAWESIRNAEEYRPPSFDSEGFIHLSYSHQVLETASRFFSWCDDLRVLEIDPNGLAPHLRIEQSADDGFFPHLYFPLMISQIVRVLRICKHTDGTFHWAD